MPDEYEQFATAECRDALEGALSAAQIRWITPPEALARAERKLYQLEIAAELGLPVPATLVSNSSRDALRFMREIGDVVVKPVRYGLVSSRRNEVAYTSVVTRREVERLSGPPVILQAHVSARAHLRVVTVGRRAFVSVLISKQLDWRSVGSNHDRFERTGSHSFPDVARSAVSLAARLGIGYSSQDWIVDVRDRMWFLEANPNGQWLFLDPPHRGAITEALVTKLEGLSSG